MIRKLQFKKKPRVAGRFEVGGAVNGTGVDGIVKKLKDSYHGDNSTYKNQGETGSGYKKGGHISAKKKLMFKAPKHKLGMSRDEDIPTIGGKSNYKPSQDMDGDQDGFKNGGGIYIKPENRGKFTATKKATGKSTEELTHSSNQVTRKRAIFAQNAKKWHHADGGSISSPAMGIVKMDDDTDNIAGVRNPYGNDNSNLHKQNVGYGSYANGGMPRSSTYVKTPYPQLLKTPEQRPLTNEERMDLYNEEQRNIAIHNEILNKNKKPDGVIVKAKGGAILRFKKKQK